jgi:hypothetical protein
VGSAASHGCVRLYNADAVDLAKRVLGYAAPGMPAKEIEKLAVRRGKTRSLQLERFVPVEIRYDIAVVERGRLIVYPDIYRRYTAETLLGAVLRIFEGSGSDSVALDSARVRALLANAGGQRVSVAIEALQKATLQ